MKVRRVLIYEGPDKSVQDTIDRSYVHGDNAVFQVGEMTIKEISCEDITETDAVKREDQRR